MNNIWRVGVEAVDHQGRSDLFTGIAAIIEDLRTAGIYDDETFARAGLSSLIEDKCGIATKVSVFKSTVINAAVKPPELDKNHPIIAGFLRVWMSSDDLQTVKKFDNNRLCGEVDKKNSKVSGGFSKLICPLYLTTGLLENKAITSNEISAIILHELGHVFSYYERLVDIVSMNYAIETCASRMLGLNTDVDRMVILSEFDKYTGINIPDKDTVVTINDKQKVYTHLSCETVKQRRNIEGNELYSYKSFEQSADQFATRHGSGAFLVTALNKIERTMWINPSYISWPLHIMIELIKVTAILSFLVMGAMTAPLSILGVLTIIIASRPLNNLYDSPVDRFKRIENEMVSELKNKYLATERREQILNDLAVVREVYSVMEDKRTFWEGVWTYVMPGGNEQRNRQEFQKVLEDLTNNQLYTASAMFR